MRTHVLRGLGPTLCLALLLAPAGLSAQEQEEQQAAGQECKLQASEAASKAAAAIEEARNAQEPQQARQAWQRALEAVVPAVSGGSEDPTPYILAAQANIGLGNYEEADRLLDRFMEIAPECGEPAENTRYNAWVGLYNQGIQAYQSGNPEEALQHFEKANLIHEDARSYNNAAILHMQQGNQEKAKELYRNAIQAGGEEEQVTNAVTNLAEILISEGKEAEAITVYEDYLADNPDDVAVRVDYALQLSEAGQADSAVAILEQILQREGLNAEQWNRVGVALFNAEEYERSVTAFTKARTANPLGKEGMENLVSALIQAGVAGEALPLADTLVAWYPYEMGNYQLLAAALAKSDQSPKALQVMQQGETTPITFESLQMAEADEGVYVIQGTVTGSEAAAGTTMTIPFEFLGADGHVVHTEELTLQVPAAEQSETVRMQVSVGQEVAGFRYRKAGSEGIQG